MGCSASSSSFDLKPPAQSKDGQGFGDCAGAETASEIVHNRAVLGSATKMRKTGPPF
jgi:hypothetical protein